MPAQEILLLGNPRLYETAVAVVETELEALQTVVADLHDTLIAFREKYRVGRAIAAPQIGVKKRLIYMFIDTPTVFINPVLEWKSPETMVLWDDCMSFPEILVKVERHRRIRLRYKDLDWQDRTMELEGDLAELLQHEYDHLDGILAVQRALDPYSIALTSQKALLTV
ncbi:peptide deformylase [Hydrogenispora ethanolica]|jgi:peptide deformylase|uniref:Peptide deformylase n=1 Tax=Hydrogenispora ethanolica TaxID=1082276 RepID=A0A4R1SA34_HYDET|nr:peptide deformylase [Hydrogenispora ethanolica]TCL76356.1 peptide deformylase [Hydrogenispora ethanolica]